MNNETNQVKQDIKDTKDTKEENKPIERRKKNEVSNSRKLENKRLLDIYSDDSLDNKDNQDIKDIKDIITSTDRNKDNHESDEIKKEDKAQEDINNDYVSKNENNSLLVNEKLIEENEESISNKKIEFMKSSDKNRETKQIYENTKEPSLVDEKKEEEERKSIRSQDIKNIKSLEIDDKVLTTIDKDKEKNNEKINSIENTEDHNKNQSNPIEIKADIPTSTNEHNDINANHDKDSSAQANQIIKLYSNDNENETNDLYTIDDVVLPSNKPVNIKKETNSQSKTINQNHNQYVKETFNTSYRQVEHFNNKNNLLSSYTLTISMIENFSNQKNNNIVQPSYRFNKYKNFSENNKQSQSQIQPKSGSDKTNQFKFTFGDENKDKIKSKAEQTKEKKESYSQLEEKNFFYNLFKSITYQNKKVGILEDKILKYNKVYYDYNQNNQKPYKNTQNMMNFMNNTDEYHESNTQVNEINKINTNTSKIKPIQPDKSTDFITRLNQVKNELVNKKTDVEHENKLNINLNRLNCLRPKAIPNVDLSDEESKKICASVIKMNLNEINQKKKENEKVRNDFLSQVDDQIDKFHKKI